MVHWISKSSTVLEINWYPSHNFKGLNDEPLENDPLSSAELECVKCGCSFHIQCGVVDRWSWAGGEVLFQDSEPTIVALTNKRIDNQDLEWSETHREHVTTCPNSDHWIKHNWHQRASTETIIFYSDPQFRNNKREEKEFYPQLLTIQWAFANVTNDVTLLLPKYCIYSINIVSK